MKRSSNFYLAAVILCLLLSACGQQSVPIGTEPTELVQTTQAIAETTAPAETEQTVPAETEEAVPPTEPGEDTFVKVEDYIPDVLVELKYATTDNFTAQIIYDFDTCWLRYGTVKKLIAVQDALKAQGLGLKIWDGFRPVSAQFKLWEVYPDPTFVANPQTGYSSHSRGNTVDLTLVDASGAELTMPTDFDSFSALADRDYSDCPAEAAEHALLLQSIMEQQGFQPYFGEWWHFSDSVKYEVEDVFDPALVSTWYAKCEEFISLRTAPDTSAEVMTRILVGEEFTLLGYTGVFSKVNYQGQTGYVLTSYTAPAVHRDELAVPEIWEPNCNEYITLREEPGGESLERINKGESFRLVNWAGAYALVDYQGKQGYVLSNYIQPESQDYISQCLSIVEPTDCYSHEQLMKDAQTLAQAYPDRVTLDSIGNSELGRYIPVLRIGREDAEYHVLLQGAIHGREHMTAWLLMAVTDYHLTQEEAVEDVCFHVIPMVNPDGVTVSQTKTLTEYQQSLHSADLHAGFTEDGVEDYAALWKANGLGVDLNRNFPSGWEAIDDRTAPSAMLYKGQRPFSAAETAALRDYTLVWGFDATLSYHASGCVIFWEYGSREAVNEQSLSLARSLEAVTGYPPQGSEGVAGAGYKDWVMEELGIPSVTVEIGAGFAPLEERELYATFSRNANVFSVIAQWLKK